MGMAVTLFLALAATTLSYAFGQGGPVAGLVFFAVLLDRRRHPRPRAEDLSPAQARVATICRYSGSTTRARSPAVLYSSR